MQLLLLSLHLEIRSHGVAYYQFATDEEKRQEQLAALNKLRDQVSIYSIQYSTVIVPC